MSTEADFTPPSLPPETADKPGTSPDGSKSGSGQQEVSFPLSTGFNISYSAYEDRLVVRCRRANREPINVLLTRRMTLIVLAQLLAHLPEISGLDKTPAQYWKEVLQMAHHQAVGGRGDRAEAGATGNAIDTDAQIGKGQAVSRATGGTEKERAGERVRHRGKLEGPIYLATALTMQIKEAQLVLAFTGLPMPSAMTEPRDREPLFAIPLQVENVHQLIQLLIDRAREAEWHLPVTLPWLESPAEGPATTLGLLH